MKQKVKKKLSLGGKDFLLGLGLGLGLVFLVGVIFFSGYWSGRWRLRQNQFCFPPKELSHPMRRVMEENLGSDFLTRWQGRALLGQVTDISLTKLVLSTAESDREFDLDADTRYLKGRTPINRVEIAKGQSVAVLLDGRKQLVRAVIVLQRP
ncbi:MAG: hypothetical protein ABID04_04070 [Patescibacteria group bacterium]